MIRTHILFDHLLSSVEMIIKKKRALVNEFFWVSGFADRIGLERKRPRLLLMSSYHIEQPRRLRSGHTRLRSWRIALKCKLP